MTASETPTPPGADLLDVLWDRHADLLGDGKVAQLAEIFCATLAEGREDPEPRPAAAVSADDMRRMLAAVGDYHIDERLDLPLPDLVEEAMAWCCDLDLHRKVTRSIPVDAHDTDMVVSHALLKLVRALRAALAGDRPQITDEMVERLPEGLTAEGLRSMATSVRLRGGSLCGPVAADLDRWAAALGDPRPDPGPSERPPTAGEVLAHVNGGGAVECFDWVDQSWGVLDGERVLWLGYSLSQVPGAAPQHGLRLVAAGVPEETPGAEPAGAEGQP